MFLEFLIFLTIDNRDTLPEIAVTGVVLVKKDYALVNAHDVSKIPLTMLKEHGRVQFYATADVPWFCKPKSYTAHPEYGPITFNTVALLELDIMNTEEPYPLKPICWTSQPLNASTFLYAAGYTDENRLLEKVIHKLQYTDNTSCSEFYHRAKLSDKTREPVYYLCGHAVSSKSHCVWDNGMVLISNATQYFTLLGFGIRGPGCAAPARFINLQYYYEWVQEVTTEVDHYDDYRRDGGFEEVPLHDLFNAQSGLREGDENRRSSVNKSIPIKHHYYSFDTDLPLYFNVEPTDADTIAVFPFNETWESFDKACNSWRTLMYREFFELKAEGRIGNAVFKMNVQEHSSAILSIKERIDLVEGEAITSSEEMVPNLMKHYPFKDLYPSPAKSENGKWVPGKLLKPTFLKEFFDPLNVTNYNLYITFTIKDKATMKFEVYGEPYGPEDPNLTTKPPGRLLRFGSEEESAEYQTQKPIKKAKVQFHQGFRNLLPDAPMFKSGFVKEVYDSDGHSLYGVINRKTRATTTVRTTTSPKYFRPLSSVIIRPKPKTLTPQWYPKIRIVGDRKILTSSTRKTTKSVPVSKRRKYDKVHMLTRAFTTSTLYPAAHVKTVMEASGAPSTVVVFRVTLVKIISFRILMLLLNS
ncbi:unnamed protein product [Arctia plantaginis]|uniref:Peptidase S1 domain-containing protein n=1 Tax=Arctia plantaginis TaxID=874455 RepID=A0A8S0ZXE5_ARCPL|nr:unnamed protein product [Arctia plantaginis]